MRYHPPSLEDARVALGVRVADCHPSRGHCLLESFHQRLALVLLMTAAPHSLVLLLLAAGRPYVGRALAAAIRSRQNVVGGSHQGQHKNENESRTAETGQLVATPNETRQRADQTHSSSGEKPKKTDDATTVTTRSARRRRSDLRWHAASRSEWCDMPEFQATPGDDGPAGSRTKSGKRAKLALRHPEGRRGIVPRSGPKHQSHLIVTPKKW
jgi:hypothetical protein